MSDDAYMKDVKKLLKDFGRAKWNEGVSAHAGHNADMCDQGRRADDLSAKLLAGIERERKMSQDARSMFVARLQNVQENGGTMLAVSDVLALLNDCDMLASRPMLTKGAEQSWPVQYRHLYEVDFSVETGPCSTCNEEGLVGGLLPDGGGYDSQPCPDCSTNEPEGERGVK